MKKFLKNAIVFFIALIMFVLLSNTTKAAEVTDAEKSKILEFIEANNILSYYNYDKVENIYITNELLHEIGGSPVTEEQRKNTDVYEMIGDLKEGFVITRDSINNYLQNTIGLTVDKLKNYDQFLNQTTTSDNKNQFYYFTITSPANYSDYAITKVEETSASTIKVTITAKMNKEEFSNVIELVKKGDSYNFVSSTSADGKSRPLTVDSDYQFNNKTTKTINSTDKTDKDNTTADTKIPQTGITKNIIIVSILSILAIIIIISLVKYNKIKRIQRLILSIILYSLDEKYNNIRIMDKRP